MGFLHIANLLLALASAAVSLPAQAWGSQDFQKDSVFVESLLSPPLGWVKDETQKVDKETAQIRLRMHLVHHDMDKFHELALNVGSELDICPLDHALN